MNQNIDLSLYKFSYKIQARWSDMDELHHINNAVYLSYLEDARGRYLHVAASWDWNVDGIILANANINYIKSLHFLNDASVYVRCIKFGNKSFDLEYIIAGPNEKGEVIIYTHAQTTLVMFDYKSKTSIIIPEHLKEKLRQFDSAVQIINT
jgi:acyl-CoA thioester hydrolase